VCAGEAVCVFAPERKLIRKGAAGYRFYVSLILLRRVPELARKRNDNNQRYRRRRRRARRRRAKIVIFIIFVQKLRQKMAAECKGVGLDTVPTAKTTHSTTENFFGDEMFHSGGKHSMAIFTARFYTRPSE